VPPIDPRRLRPSELARLLNSTPLGTVVSERQLYRHRMTAKEIVLPTIPGSRASGAIIKVAGLTGRIRGMKYKRADGQTVRPSLVVLDDPQTDESARSLSQCATRESTLAGAVLGPCCSMS